MVVVQNLMKGCTAGLDTTYYCRVGYNLLLQGWIQPTAGLETANCRVGHSLLQGWIQPTTVFHTTYYRVGCNVMQGWIQPAAGLKSNGWSE